MHWLLPGENDSLVYDKLTLAYVSVRKCHLVQTHEIVQETGLKYDQEPMQAKLIAFKIKSEVFKAWPIKELEGYRNDDRNLPKYRIVSCDSVPLLEHQVSQLQEKWRINLSLEQVKTITPIRERDSLKNTAANEQTRPDINKNYEEYKYNYL